MNVLSLNNIFLILGIFFDDVVNYVLGAQIPWISKFNFRQFWNARYLRSNDVIDDIIKENAPSKKNVIQA